MSRHRNSHLSRSLSRAFLLLTTFCATFPILLLLSLLDTKLGIMWGAAMFVLLWYVWFRNSLGQEFAVALLFALFVTSYHPYEYSGTNYFIGHINLYPLVCWTAGLILTREIYIRLNLPFVAASLLYIGVLLLLEYIGYYTLNVRLVGNMPSLFGTGIMHGPLFLHSFYLLAGPVYLICTDYLLKKKV